MIKSFLIICFLIFTVIGICEFIYLLRKLLFYPGIHTCNYSIIILKRCFAVNQLKFFWQKYKWQGNEFAKEIIARTDDIHNDELEACKQYIIGKNIILCSLETVNEFFENNKEIF